MDLNNTESSVRKGMRSVSLVHIYVILLSLHIFEEIFVDLVFKCVDIVGG